MIEYVVESNPDDRILARASRILREGGLVCFPTESSWVVAADPYNKESVKKLYRLRHVENTKHFTIMVPSFKKAMEISEIEDSAFSLIKKVTPGPYTFIMKAQKKIIKYLDASKHDHEVGIRFPVQRLCQALLKAHDDVLITTHLNQQMLEMDDDLGVIYSALIEDHFNSMIDLIIDPGEVEFIGSTTIIDFTTGEPQVIREGAGDISIFLRD